MRNIFVQFYSRNNFELPPKYIYTENRYKRDVRGTTMFLCNGFSNISKFVEKDIYWVHYPLAGSFEETFQNNMDVELPFESGNIYVSALYFIHLRQVIVWSLKYPKLKFVVGGPAIRHNNFPFKSKNLKLVNDTANEYFNQKIDWDIVIPETEDPEKTTLIFGYDMGEKCYWNKCIFCRYNVESEDKPFDESLIDKIQDKTSHFQRVMINITNPSLSPSMLDILPKLTERKGNYGFQIFLRSDKAIVKKLKEVLPKCNYPEIIRPFIGLEFPSDRMLKIINKGITLDTYLQFKELTDQYNMVTYTKLILGWPNLIEDDVKEANKFFSNMNSNTTIMIVGGLLIQPGSYLDTHSKEILGDIETEDVYNGPIYAGYYPVMSREQELLNNSIVVSCYKHKLKYMWDSWSESNFRHEQAT